MEFEGKIQKFIRQEHMTEAGQKLLVGLSGGADSVCLLMVLWRLREVLGIQLHAVHVNHELRGEAALADQNFSQELCQRLGIPCKVVSRPVAQLAEKWKMGEEEAGRKVRYQVYHETLEEVQGDRIALAHHMDDLAETFLFHAVRGSSLAGLASIPSVSGQVIRPLLCVTREEIEAYLASCGETFCTDFTNGTLDYTRNRLRHLVLPVLREQINRKAVEHIAHAAADIAEAEAYLLKEAEACKDRYVKEVEDKLLLKKELEALAPLMQRYVIRLAILELINSRKDLGRIHLEAVRDLFDMQVGKRLSLPLGLEAERGYEGVYLMRKEIRDVGDKPFDRPQDTTLDLRKDGGICRFGELEIAYRIFPYQGQGIPKKPYTKWLDCDKINNDLLVRNRRSGDYMTVMKEGHRKKIKELLIEAKIPSSLRGSIPLLASGSEVLWVMGLRFGESCRVRETTGRVLELTIINGKELLDSWQQKESL